MGLEADVRVFQMNKSLRREGGICHLPASLPRRAISAASLVTQTSHLSRSPPRQTAEAVFPCLVPPGTRVEPFASAPGSCPPGLGAGAIVPLTGLWWHSRFCAVGLCSGRERACPKSQPVSGGQTLRPGRLAPRSALRQARWKPKGLGAVCRPEDAPPLGTGIFYRGQGMGFFSRH